MYKVFLSFFFILSGCSHSQRAAQAKSNDIAYTEDLLAELKQGLLAYEIEEGGFPEKLALLVPLYFQSSKKGILDSWDSPVAYNKSEGELRSGGADRTFRTSDDIILKVAPGVCP